MQRTVQAEWLDALTPDDPEALHNRRDLRLTNAVMGNFRWFHRCLLRGLQPGEPILELAAGAGDLGRFLQPLTTNYTGLDLWPRPAAWPRHWEWHQTDWRVFPHYGRFPVVLVNLFLHQLSAGELRDWGAALGRTSRLILACEPARRRRSQLLYRVFGRLLRANRVSLHDAHVSIAAGFLGDELPQLLGLAPASWNVQCETTALGAYRMVAVRRDES